MDQRVAFADGDRVWIAPHCYHSGETGVIDGISHNPSGSVAYYNVKLDKCPDNKAFSHIQLIGEDLECL